MNEIPFAKPNGSIVRRMGLLFGLLLGSCASQQGWRPAIERPDVSPRGGGASTTTIPLDSSQIKPMFTELLPIDLPTVVRVAVAQNTDIMLARLNVTAVEGGYESAVGAAFPAIVPTALFEHVEGSVRATEGKTFSANRTDEAFAIGILPG